MKKILLSLLIAASFLTGCESYLDQTNPNKITADTFFKTESDFLSGLAAAYTPMRNPAGGYFNVRTMEIRNYRGDDVNVRNDTEALYQVHLFINSSDNQNVMDLFSQCYSAIYRANTLLEKIEEANLTASFKNTIIGESYFIRGLHYLFLASEFGDVPIRLKASQAAENFPIAKSSQTEVYAQAASDLKEAAELLPLVHPEKGRATKGAALAFLGKIYMYTEDWDNAIAQLELLTSAPYNYKLTADYAWNFDLTHEFNEESIFEVAYQKVGAATDRWGQETAGAMLTSPMNRIFGCGDVGGWDICNGNQKLLSWSTEEKDLDGNIDYRTRTSLSWNYPGCIYYLKPFTTSVKPANHAKIFIRKYTYCNDLAAEPVPESEINIRAFRYANVLLYLAEAYNNKENTTKALTYLNQIRHRANLALLSSDATTEQIKQDIIKQRSIEFIAEGERFYDLRRWGMLEKEIKNNTTEIRSSNFNLKKHSYLPIPTKEILTNPLCTQNQGW